MLAHLRANLVAYLALFVALGGTSYAALRLPANSVGTRQLRTAAVRTADIAGGAVTPAKLSRAAREGISGPKGDAGQPGPPGAPGAPGLQGEQGPQAVTLYAFVQPVGSGDEVFVPPKLVRSRGVTATQRAEAGNFVLTFDRDVSGCAWSATLVGFDAQNATTWPGPGEIAVGSSSTLSANQLRVMTYGSAGNQGDLTPGGPTGFMVNVFC